MDVKKEAEIIDKLKKAVSPTDAKGILMAIRRTLVNGESTYQEALRVCVHQEDISKEDDKYPIFQESLADFLKGKSKNEQIWILSELIVVMD